MRNKISGGINISPLISSMILLSARLSLDKRNLMTESAKLSTKTPKKKLAYKKPSVKPEPVKNVKSTKKNITNGKNPVKKMKGGCKKDFFE